MTISIDFNTTLGEISHTFSKEFPFLKIIFYKWNDEYASKSTTMLSEDLFVNQFISLQQVYFLEIHPWDQTHQVELKFQQKIHIKAEILRQYNNRWIRTKGSDDLTLAAQNELGQQHAGEEIPFDSRFIQ